MSSYFTLTLDTTGPQIEIHAPSYTNRTTNNIITVVGNEPLSNYQDIYIVDSQGTRHNVTFSFDGNMTFSGNVVLTDYPIGMATIFAQLQDVVGNLSNTATSNMTVITTSDSLMLDLTLSDISSNKVISIADSIFAMSEKESVKLLSEKQTIKSVSEKARLATISERN